MRRTRGLEVIHGTRGVLVNLKNRRSVVTNIFQGVQGVKPWSYRTTQGFLQGDMTRDIIIVNEALRGLSLASTVRVS